MTLSGVGPTLAVEGAITAIIFEAYVEKVITTSLCTGRLIVMDNLGPQAKTNQGIDRAGRLRALISTALLA